MKIYIEFERYTDKELETAEKILRYCTKEHDTEEILSYVGHLCKDMTAQERKNIIEVINKACNATQKGEV